MKDELPTVDECFFCGLPLPPGYSGHVCPDPPMMLPHLVEYLAPDYEALGYPETRQGSTGRYELDEWVDRRLYVMADAGVYWCRVDDNDKKQVDDKEKDS